MENISGAVTPVSKCVGALRKSGLVIGPLVDGRPVSVSIILVLYGSPAASGCSSRKTETEFLGS